MGSTETIKELGRLNDLLRSDLLSVCEEYMSTPSWKFITRFVLKGRYYGIKRVITKISEKQSHLITIDAIVWNQ